MPELKKYLDFHTPFQRVLFIILLSFVVFLCLFLIVPAVMNGFPIFMLILPLGLFVGIGVFLYRSFHKSANAYDTWWNSLTGAEQADIEQDFRQAHQVSDHLIAGQRYAFIRQAGRVVPYDQITGFDIRFSQSSRNYLHIMMKDGHKIVVCLHTLRAAEQLQDDLRNYRNQKSI